VPEGGCEEEDGVSALTSGIGSKVFMLLLHLVVAAVSLGDWTSISLRMWMMVKMMGSCHFRWMVRQTGYVGSTIH